MPLDEPGPPESAAVRVLAFTCSAQRPLMLRHGVLQMQKQSFPVDLAIYLNSPEPEPDDHTLITYDRLLEDAWDGSGRRLILGHGPTLTHHENFCASLGLIDLDDYDLFLKIDDDDIYYRHYAEEVVDDFVAKRWDYSGTHSHGLLNGRHWYPNSIIGNMGLSPEDIELRIPAIMPSSAAYSRRAIGAIVGTTGTTKFDDTHWRRVVARMPGVVMAERQDKNFVYHLHGANASMASYYMP